MNDLEGGSQHPGVADPSAAVRASRARSERRSGRRETRKQKQRNRLLGVSFAVILIAAAVLVTMNLLGDRQTGPEPAQLGSTTASDAVTTPERAEESPVTSLVASPVASSAAPLITPLSTTTAGPQSPGVALLLTEGDTLAAVVVLQPGQRGGVALGMPAETLVRTTRSFATMSELHASGDIEALSEGLETIVGVSPRQVGSLETEAIRQALIDAGLDATWPSAGDIGTQEARQAADAILQLARLAVSGADSWEDLPLEGDAAAVRETVAGLVAGDTGVAWEAAVLPGRPVVGDGFAYFEADVPATRLLLAGAASTAEIVLAVLNGSGVVGIAEAAAEFLAPLGYTLLPFANAAGFPDVRKTVITVAPGAATAGQQIRTLLGVGEISEDESLQAGNIVVVVGADFVLPSSADGVSTR